MNRIIFIFLVTALTIVSCSTKTENKIKNSDEVKQIQSVPDFNVALEFLNEYIEYTSPESKHSSEDNWVENNKLLTKKFKTVYRNLLDSAYKVEPMVGLDFDPIIDGNNCPREGFEILNYDNNTGYLTLRGKDWKEFEVTMKVVNEGNKWLIDGSGIVNIPKNKQAKRN